MAQMRTVKNPDFDRIGTLNNNANSGTQIGDFITQTSGPNGNTPLKEQFSNDELIYSASKQSLPTQSRPVINLFPGKTPPAGKSKTSLRGIKEETCEDVESAKLHILGN